MPKRDRIHSKDNTHADSIWIYFIQEADSDLFKIGFSNDSFANSWNSRFSVTDVTFGSAVASKATRVPTRSAASRLRGLIKRV